MIVHECLICQEKEMNVSWLLSYIKTYSKTIYFLIKKELVKTSSF